MTALNAGEAHPAPALTPIDPAFHDPARRTHVEVLLTAYPDITENELGTIVSFLHSGKQFDVGMVSGDERFAGKITAIRKAHPASFGSALTHTIWFLLLLIVPMALVCFLPILLGRS